MTRILCWARLLSIMLCFLGILVASYNATFAREVNLEPESPPEHACTGKSCLVIANDATYCSVDPYSMGDDLFFATKSTLTLPAGAFSLPRGTEGTVAFRNSAGVTLHPDLRIASRNAAVVLPSAFDFVIRREADPDPLEHIDLSAAMTTNAPSQGELHILTLRWPQDQFYQGDPDHAAWFYEGGRNIYLSVDAEGLFPGVSKTSVHYAPCVMADRETHAFRFAFENGESVQIDVRFVNGAAGVGYYMGRTLRARGKFSGTLMDVTDRNNLAYFGSTRSWSELAVPGLAIRLPPKGGVCGILFDPGDWDDANAVNGYFAYEMTCEERRGRKLPLAAATYPSFFVLP